MARVGADGLLYGPHKPGDDNFHNPLTNTDFRVTPPVRKVSLSSESPGGYFEPTASGGNSGAATPRATTDVTTPSQSTEEPLRRVREEEQHGGSDHPGTVSAATHPQTNSQQPQLETKNGETSFGTNLTTGRREYLSQYAHLQDEKPSPGTPIERWEDYGDSIGTGWSSQGGWGYVSDDSSGTESSINDIY